MKKALFFVLLMIFSLSASTAFTNNSDPKNASDNPAVPDKKENKLSKEEISRLTKRIEEIRDIDKTNLTVKEKRELRKELKGIKENVRKSGGYIYISAGTLILIIILIILLV
jgi:peptidoglycan hydrolase CwlO-like protein